jgi:hypothetical protein
MDDLPNLGSAPGEYVLSSVHTTATAPLDSEEFINELTEEP